MYYYGLNADGTVKGYCNTKEVADFAGYTLESETEPVISKPATDEAEHEDIADTVGKINDDFTEARNDIVMCFMDSVLNGDTDTQAELKEDMEALREEYDNALNGLLEEE